MKRMTLAAPVAALALLAAGCGGSDATSSRTTDRAFAREMVPHHESAVEMAEVGLQRAQSPFVRELSAAIVRSQSAEVGQLRAADARLAEDGVPRRGGLGLDHSEMGMAMDARSLRRARPFDVAFVRMMLPHHEGAIAMARVELQRGGDRALRSLAFRITREQQREIDAMRAFLRAQRAS